MRSRVTVLALAFALAVVGCTSVSRVDPAPAEAQASAPESVLRTMVVDPQLEDRILALDPENVSDDDVRKVLAAGPTPRIVALHGLRAFAHELQAGAATIGQRFGHRGRAQQRQQRTRPRPRPHVTLIVRCSRCWKP